MPNRRTLRFSVGLLVSSLLLNVLLVSCAADDVTGPNAQDTAQILAKLDVVLERLSALEAQVGRQSDSVTTRLDVIATRIDSGGGGGAGGALDSFRVDSILALASFLALEAVSGSRELCGGVEIAVAGGGDLVAEATAKAKGSLGGWAGTGAYAGAVVDFKQEYTLGLEVATPLAMTGCVPLSPANPPARASGSGDARLATASFTSSLAGVAAQLGLDEGRVNTAVQALGSAFQAPASLRIQDATSLLPLPSGLAALLGNPSAALQAQIPAKVDEAIALLCGGGWGARVSDPITFACNRIASGQTDIGGLFAVAEEFPALQASVTAVSNRTSTLCTRVNTIGGASLTIPNPLSIGPTPFYGPSRLFPSYTSLSC